MFHVLLTGDSLSMPRPWLRTRPEVEPEKFTGIAETYPWLLRGILTKQDFGKPVEVTHWPTRASGLGAVLNQKIDLFAWMEPNITIIHRGVVDCWPRETKGGEPNTSLGEFRVICDNILEARKSLNPTLPLIVVGIMPTNEKMREKYPQVEEQIKLYNTELKRMVGPGIEYADTEELHRQHGEGMLHPDGHHLSRFGHSILADELAKKVIAIHKANSEV